MNWRIFAQKLVKVVKNGEKLSTFFPHQFSPIFAHIPNGKLHFFKPSVPCIHTNKKLRLHAAVRVDAWLTQCTFAVKSIAIHLMNIIPVFQIIRNDQTGPELNSRFFHFQSNVCLRHPNINPYSIIHLIYSLVCLLGCGGNWLIFDWWSAEIWLRLILFEWCMRVCVYVWASL